MITTKIILDKRRETKNGFPVTLRVTFDRQPRVFPVDIYLSEKDFQRVTQNTRLKEDDKRVRSILTAIENKASKIIDELGNEFSFDDFKAKFTKKKITHDVFSVFDLVISEATAYGTKVSYGNAKNKFQSYINPGWKPGKVTKKLDFSKVTAKWLEEFEESEVQNNGLSKNTIGIYMRSLRVVFNKAIELGIISDTAYPFGKKKYIIPSNPKKKTPLNKEEVRQIASLEITDHPQKKYYRDLWLFSYLANGANIQDIIKLKWSNLTEDTIYFIREKTKNSNRASNEFVEVYRAEPINKIIADHGNRNSEYIFPVLKGGETPEQVKRIKNQLIKQINKYLRQAAKQCGISKDITTYVARHSFSNVTLNNGGSIEYIQEALGHKNPQTTLTYLKGFELKEKKKQAESLL